jgi:tetratricopeptide (TPR) repeat protein
MDKPKHTGEDVVADLERHGVESREVGLVAAGDVHLTGTNVAGRDLIIQHYQEQPLRIPESLFQLPPDILDFTGRDRALKQASAWFASGRDTGSQALLVTAISGTAGVGKTALAVHIAHGLRTQFPDGQLYVNLRGVERQRLDPADVLAGFLRAFGIEPRVVPADLEERAAMYRALLVNRRVLVVLDNASDERQVRPLLPGSPTCAVLITSRARLSALEAAQVIALDVMEEEQCIELLGKIIGDARLNAEPDAAKAIVRLCGRLPLAVRIAGARLRLKDHWRLARLADRLRAERQRLDELHVGDLEVRAMFALSYENLGDEERRAFRLLGLLQGPDFAAWVVAALLACELSEGEDITERLVDAQLLEVTGEDATGHLRYRFHDLLRAFARERLRAEEPQDQAQAARLRAYGGYLALSKRALYLLSPQSKRDAVESEVRPWHVAGLDPDEIIEPTPFAWFTVETANLIAAIEQAYEAGLWEMTWELTDPLHYLFRVHSQWKDWVATHELALDATRRAGNRRGQGWILRNLGNAYRDQGRLEEALACYEEGLALFRGLGNRLGEAAMLNGSGEVRMSQGLLPEALAYQEQALQAWTDVDDLTGVAYCHTHLSVLQAQQGRFEEALEHANRSLAMQRQFHDRSGEAYALNSIGTIYRFQDQLDEAMRTYRQCFPIWREIGQRSGEAGGYVNLGLTYRQKRQLLRAIASFNRAILIYSELGDQAGQARALAGMGGAHLDQGRLSEATRCFDSALTVFDETGDILSRATMLVDVGALLQQHGDRPGAERRWREALAVFEQTGALYASEVRARLEALEA